MGRVCYKSSMFEAAVKSYREVQSIAHDLGLEKEEADACLKLGGIFHELKLYEKAIISYQDSLNLTKNVEDKEMQLVATQTKGRMYLTLASVYSKDCDYEKAIECYEKVLNISGKEPIDDHLLKEAQNGLTSIRDVQKSGEKKADAGKKKRLSYHAVGRFRCG